MRLFIVMVTVVLLSQLIWATFLTDYFTSRYQEQTRELGLNPLRNASYTISSAIKCMDAAAYSLAYSTSVQKYLNIMNHQSNFYVLIMKKEVTAILNAFSTQSLSGVHYTIYATRQRKGIVSTIDNSIYINYGYDYQQEPWYKYFHTRPDARRVSLTNQYVNGFVAYMSKPVSMFVY